MNSKIALRLADMYIRVAQASGKLEDATSSSYSQKKEMLDVQVDALEKAVKILDEVKDDNQ